MRTGTYFGWAALLGVGLAAGATGCSSSSEDVTPLPTDDASTADAGSDAAADVTSEDATAEDSGVKCPSAAFLEPTAGATLTEKNDLDGDFCANGFQLDVKITAAADDGTKVVLYAGTTKLGTQSIKAGAATFAAVQLAQGATKLSAQIGSAACTVDANVTVACAGAPTCTVSKPTHALLNGVPVADGGDRVSQSGSDYQAAFEVTTDVADGQTVSLSVTDAAGTVVLPSTASAGKATFNATLKPDGDFQIEAACTAKSGFVGHSSKGTFTVDSSAPDLTVDSALAGKHFDPTDDFDPATAGLQFQICGGTTASDALDTGSSNFCAAIGAASTCAPATAGQSGGCVTVTCPGGPPFDVAVTLRDGAGNPTTTVVQGISCSSQAPAVQIVSPVTGTNGDVSKHLLAASSSQAVRDQDAVALGAQYTVVACSDTQSGEAELFAGLAGGTLASLGKQTVIDAVGGDACPSGYPYAAHFAVTLPESDENASGALVNATELRVDVTDVGQTTGTSSVVDLWVDSITPTVSPLQPTPLCGQLFQTTQASVQQLLQIASSSLPLSVTITHNGSVFNATGSSYAFTNVVDFGTVAFATGTSEVVATTSEPSGNAGALQSPCTVTVGNPPVVTWTSPAATSKLNAASDAAPATPGWQGTLTVHTDLAGVAGATVQFATDAGNLGSPVAIDASGDASLSASLPDGTTQLVATTSSAPGRGQGSGLIAVTVDTSVPSTVSSLVATVKSRRATSFHLAWTSPTDGAAAAAGYDVRVSKSPIDATNFAAAEAVAYTGTPAQPGQLDGVDVGGRFIENDYYFAVRAFDAAGNVGTLAATTATRAKFNTTVLAGSGAVGSNEQYGRTLDGSTDLDGDGLTDLVVGPNNGNAVYIYYGSASGYPATPSVKITGPGGQFGRALAVVGDIDGDGKPELAVGAPADANGGKVYVFGPPAAGGTALSYTAAKYVIDVDPGADAGYTGGRFGDMVARVGDFDGDGIEDFAIAAPRYASQAGAVYVVRGRAAGTPFTSVTLGAAPYGGRAIAIVGEAGSAERFGTSVVGMRGFFGSASSTLVVSGPRSATNSGKVFVFHGQAAAGGTIAVATADQTATGGAGAQLGETLAPLGAIGGTQPALGIAAPSWYVTAAAPFGTGYVHVGVAAGPLVASPGAFTDSAASHGFTSPNGGDGFANCIVGGAFSGVSTTTSFIGGDTVPDVVFSSLAENGATPKVYFLSGSHAAQLLTTSTDVAAAADVAYTVPAAFAPYWTASAAAPTAPIGCSGRSSAIIDLNGDGFGDVGLGTYSVNGSPDGGVLVLW